MKMKKKKHIKVPYFLIDNRRGFGINSSKTLKDKGYERKRVAKFILSKLYFHGHICNIKTRNLAGEKVIAVDSLTVKNNRVLCFMGYVYEKDIKGIRRKKGMEFKYVDGDKKLHGGIVLPYTPTAYRDYTPLYYIRKRPVDDSIRRNKNNAENRAVVAAKRLLCEHPESAMTIKNIWRVCGLCGKSWIISHDTEYHFRHPVHGDRHCTTYLLRKEFDLSRRNMYKMINTNKRTIVDGWFLVEK